MGLIIRCIGADDVIFNQINLGATSHPDDRATSCIFHCNTQACLLVKKGEIDLLSDSYTCHFFFSTSYVPISSFCS